MIFNEKSFDDKLGLILISLGLFFLLLLTYTGFSNLNVWYDTIFSFRLAQLPLTEFFIEGVNDVHPLLYYFIFKVFINVFEIFNVNNVVLIGKFVSLLPVYLLVILGILKIKKRFGLLTCGIFTFCIISMPFIPKFMLELRMYSWALFFVTSALIYVIEIIHENKLKYWLILILLTVCGANTHYFAALSLFCLYFIFLIYIIFKNRNLVKNYVLCIISSIVLYSFWIPYLLKQFAFGQKSFWVELLSLDGLKELFYIFSPTFHDYPIFACLLLFALLTLFIYSLYNRKENMEFAYIAIATFILVIMGTVIFSLFVFPLFNIRFLFPVFGCLWVGVAILLGMVKNKKLFILILLILIFIGSVCVLNQVNVEHSKYESTVFSNQTIQNIISPNDTIIYTDSMCYIYFSAYSLKNSNNILAHDLNELKDCISKDKNSYLISSDGNFSEFCLNNNITIMEIYSYADPCMLNHNITVYKVV